MSKRRIIPQSYPLMIAWARNLGLDDEPSTEEGRYSIADHAAMTDSELNEIIYVNYVIGWLLCPDGDARDEPMPLTPNGFVEVIDGRGTYVKIYRYGKDVGIRMEVLEMLRGSRDRALRRCEGHGICPTGHASPPVGLIDEYHRDRHR